MACPCSSTGIKTVQPSMLRELHLYVTLLCMLAVKYYPRRKNKQKNYRNSCFLYTGEER